MAGVVGPCSNSYMTNLFDRYRPTSREALAKAKERSGRLKKHREPEPVPSAGRVTITSPPSSTGGWHTLSGEDPRRAAKYKGKADKSAVRRRQIRPQYACRNGHMHKSRAKVEICESGTVYDCGEPSHKHHSLAKANACRTKRTNPSKSRKGRSIRSRKGRSIRTVSGGLPSLGNRR
jgi:hypothetical protein